MKETKFQKQKLDRDDHKVLDDSTHILRKIVEYIGIFIGAVLSIFFIVTGFKKKS